MNKDITIIMGPTAIGKSDYALNFARKIDAEIISADAFQIYRHMDIGTAKVTMAIRQQIPHHLIDIKNPDEPFNVVDFISLAGAVIEQIRTKNKSIIICGGTAFYLNAFLYEYKFSNKSPDFSLREELFAECQKMGNQAFWEKLNKIDSVMAKIIKPQNTRRLVRAFEIFYTNNELPSKIRQRNISPRSDTKIILLSAPREVIYERINNRVEEMYKNGLVEEVQNLLKIGYKEDLPAFLALGYKETIEYLKGSISYREVINLVSKLTRHFAKRQLTWYKKFENVTIFDITKQ